MGLDPLLGLVPGLGDVAGAALSGYIVTIAARLGAPGLVLVRMLGNVGVDLAIGSIPFLGDLFDFGWKANTRNLALVERYLTHPEKTHRSSALMVGVTLAGLGLLAVGAVAIGYFALKGVISILS